MFERREISRRIRRAALAAACLAALAACESAEERAEGHYRRALSLIEAGEIAKARIEFRNVFRLDGSHAEARYDYAMLLSAEGAVEEAAAQFLLLAEQDPQHLEARRQLSRIMLLAQDWDEAERHIDAAFALAPEDPEIATLKATIDYRMERREQALARARALIDADPDNIEARLIPIADLMNRGAHDEALGLIEAALARAPDDLTLNTVRLAALEALERTEEIGAQLRRLTGLAPQDRGIATSLFLWLVRADEPDEAETVLRGLLARDPADRGTVLMLVRFLASYRGLEAARAELVSGLEAEDPVRALHTRLLAEFEAEQGNPARAVALLEDELARPDDPDAPADPGARDAARILLARILRMEGAEARAAELVAAVLERDPANVAALTERARQRLAAEDHAGAIGDLRAALNEDPSDAEVLTVLARAHERAGNPDLARERLALAVEVSGRAPDESLRYAEFLSREGKLGVAESVLADTLQRNPSNRAVLAALGQLRLAAGDWSGARESAARLEALGTPEGRRAAAAIASRALAAQQRSTEAIRLLLGQVAADPGDGRALRELVVAYLRAGQAAQAEAALEREIARAPDDDYLQFLMAGLRAVTGRTAEAEALYRGIITRDPTAARAYEALAALLGQLGREAEAVALIRAGLDAAPGDARLSVIRAGQLEREGDFEAALAIYDRLYAADPDDALLANNLASMLAEHRDDAESLARAGRIAQRLRTSSNPAFLDTYGWVLYRQGAAEQALEPLMRAVQGLPEVALVRYHAGIVQAGLGMTAQARENLSRALELAGPDNMLPATARARAAETLAGLPPAGGDPDGGGNAGGESPAETAE